VAALDQVGEVDICTGQSAARAVITSPPVAPSCSTASRFARWAAAGIAATAYGDWKKKVTDSASSAITPSR
jgi:hypothetical protein